MSKLYFDNELREKLGFGNRRFICWDEETQAKLADYAEIIADDIFMDSVRDAELGMSAVAMGYSPYDAMSERSGSTSAYAMNEAINRAYHSHIVCYRAPIEYDESDLPF